MVRKPAPGRAAREALGDARSLPDRAWIAALTGRSREEIDGWLAEADAAAAVERAIRAAHEKGGRESYAQFRAPFDLYAIVRAVRPRVILETGVSSGVSSAHLLLAVRKNRSGHLISIDLPTRQAGTRLRRGESIVSIPPGRSSGWAIPAGLRRGWDLRVGDARELVPAAVRRLRGLDLFLHDDRHTPEHLDFELATIEPILAEGAIVLADNTAWTGDAFDRFAARHGVPVHKRRGSDLVGLRLPERRRPVPRGRLPGKSL